MNTYYTTRTSCRVCHSTNLTFLFSLGNQYVSDFVSIDGINPTVPCLLCGGTGIRTSYADSEKRESLCGIGDGGCNGDGVIPATIPIDLELCRNCGLVQAKHSVPQDLLYGKHYWYRSGTTATMRMALADVAAAAVKKVKIEPGDVILDIGANDGTLLKQFGSCTSRAVRVGCEPAPNLQEECSKHCDVLIRDFWNEGAYWRLGRREAKIITACGMFYDLDDPNQFIADVASVLHPEGLFVAQLMCLKQTLVQKDVGNFAHEHLEFYSLRSLEHLLRRHGLTIVDIEENRVNGGSYRLYVRHIDKSVESMKVALKMDRFFEVEEEMKISDPNTYSGSFQELEKNKNECVAFVKSVVEQGKKVWVYGASTKGNVILQYYGLDGSSLEMAIDRSPEKHGKYMIGSGIPIYEADSLDGLTNPPDYALVLPYAFLPEFMARESAWRDNGGKFIVPLPEFRVI